MAVRENAGKGTNGADEVYTAAEIDDVLPQADFVLLCAPLTPATRGIINAARLAKMKRDAYIVNVSRGPLIVEDDLIDALKKKRIGGAALDVFIQEPLPLGSAFWRLDNVLITPHTASFTEQLWERHYQHIVENMKRFLAGLTVATLVGQLGMKTDRVAVELNLEIVPRSSWDSTQLKDGDKLELVHFVGGGA